MRLSHLLLGAALLPLAAPAPAPDVAPLPPRQAPAPAPRGDGRLTLAEAFARAYATNPDLASERATLRATDENVPIARAAGLPSLTSTGGINQSIYNTAGSGSPGRRADVGLDASVPIYNGGSVRTSVRAAQTRVLAGRANLRSVENDLFTQVTTVYLNVIRDEAIVRLNEQNVRVLEVNLQATQDRFEVGDLTLTDVAQSQSRLAIARGQLETARAQLIASRESFLQVVGSPPGTLETPPPLPNLPTDVEAAVETALDENPNLEVAQRQRQASGYDVDVARAARQPRVSVGGGVGYYDYLGSVSGGLKRAGVDERGVSLNAGVNVSLPLFSGGRPQAQIRQAQERETAAAELVTLTERGVVAQVRSAYARYQSSLRVIESSRVAVEGSRKALEGVRAENSVGTRTILDVLNAEQEFLQAQVQYVTAERDAYVAGFNLIAAMGMAGADRLGLDGGALYDPTGHYDRVQRAPMFQFDIGTRVAPAAAPTGTTTVGTPAQTPAVTDSLDPLLQRPVDSMAPNPAGD